MPITIAAPAKCPRCKHVVDDLIVEDGRLLTADRRVQILSFVCGACNQVVRWNPRGEPQRMKR